MPIKATGPKTVQMGDGQRTLIVTAEPAGYAALTSPDHGGDVVLPEAEAVEAIAAWINGKDLPEQPALTEPTDAMEGFYDDVFQAALDACAPKAAAGDWPVATQGRQDPLAMLMVGPELAYLEVIARTDHDGNITGAAWNGRSSSGASIYGHGYTPAALKAAQEWASGLDKRAAITPVGLRARREATGATQTDLARLLKVGQGVISRWESGKAAPRDPDQIQEAITNLEALADDLYQDALHSPTDTLVTWQTDQDYWAADPTAAQQGTPASMHRVAVARAAATLTSQGHHPRIVLGEP